MKSDNLSLYGNFNTFTKRRKNKRKNKSLIPKQPSCKKVCSPQEGHWEERCEIQGGDQEMALMVG